MLIGKGVVIDKGCNIGPGVAIWNNTVIRSNVIIGAGTTIGHLAVIERDTVIGRKTTIQSQCHITAEAIIGDNCFFGPGVIMTNEKNIANQDRTQPKIERAIIGNGVRIGAGCLLLPGVNIGNNAFVAAGSLVSKDIPKGEFWAGRPARKVKDVPSEEFLGPVIDKVEEKNGGMEPCEL